MEKKKILVADDEPIILDLVTEYLELNGFQVLTAKDGAEAVKVVHDQDGAIDLMVLDITMPELSGIEAFQEVRETYGDIPVIFSSGYNEARTFSGVPEDIPKNFVQKPYNLSELLEIIRKMI